MKGTLPKPSDPGQKEPSFPAWLLRYAAPEVQIPLAAPRALDSEKTDELGYSELDRFEEVQMDETDQSEPSLGEASKN